MKIRPFGTKRVSGFTLIEILTVLAIIGILIALLLPAFASAQERARRGTCQSNLQQIYQAVELFRKDTMGFPPGLWDAPNYANLPNAGLGGLGTTASGSVVNGIPASAGANAPQGLRILLGVTTGGPNPQVVIPPYLNSYDALHCPENLDTNTADLSTTTTVGYDNYDAPDPYAVAQGLDTYLSVQTYGLQRFAVPATAAIAADPDFTRQLYLKSPAESTVLTWCFEHRPLVSGIPTPQVGRKDDIYLFLDGHTKVGLFGNFLNSANCPNHNEYANGVRDTACP